MTAMRYRVTRLCCRSGMCLECKAWANGTERKRVTQLETANKDRAEECAKNFEAWGAKIEMVSA